MKKIGWILVAISLMSGCFKVHCQTLHIHTESNPMVQISSVRLLSELYEQTFDKGKTLVTEKKKDANKETVKAVNYGLPIAERQQQDEEEHRATNSRKRTMEMGGVVITVVLFLSMGFWWHHRRMNRLRIRLDEHNKRITENLAEIERLQQSGEVSEHIIAELNKQIKDSRERIAYKLLIGTKAFLKLQEKQCVAEMTANERHCLIDYYGQLRPKQWQQWERTYNPLTPAQYLFLILQDDLHYDDDTIANILDVKPASLRTLRSRIKRREKRHEMGKSEW